MLSAMQRFAPLPDGAEAAEGSVTHPAGFLAAGVAAGIKRSGRRDVGLLVSETPAVSAAFFTQNRAAAAPILVTRDSCDCAALQAVVVNSGNANACTGAQGHADALRMRELVAGLLSLPEEQVAVSSTGVIGAPLPMDVIEPGMERAAAKLDHGGGERFAAAIRTTDRTEKLGAADVELPSGAVRLGFAAKGAGMISPNMATTLCFVTTDAGLDAATWRRLLGDAVEASFNRITVDGQESTNDMVLGLANGASGVRLGEEDLGLFSAALRAGLLAMALGVVSDGEGATTIVRLSVEQALDEAEAERVGRAIADSPLVKTAVYGKDANWGRIVQSAGMSLSPDGDRELVCDVVFGGVPVLVQGDPVALSQADEEHIAASMADAELDIGVVLHRGDASSLVYFSDLTHEYVRINAGTRT